MNIAIASGKGGTGKTTVAANLAAYLSDQGLSVGVADCDVEEPNLHLFLKAPWTEQHTESVPVPVVDHDICLGEKCVECVASCRFKSLIFMGGEIMVFPELCHGCGLCSLVCKPGAITESGRDIGVVRQGVIRGLDVTGGELKIGEAMSPPLISAVKSRAEAGDIHLWDCPPGTSCPVIEALHGADAAILVTESTPFGLHDLKLAVETLRKLNIPFGVVINRDGMGDGRVDVYLKEEGIPLLGRLPHSLEAAQSYSRGELHIDAMPEFAGLYAKLWDNVQKLAQGDAR